MGYQETINEVNAKATKRKNERVAKVTELIMSGLNGVQIWKYCTEKLNWEVTQRMVWKYVNAANEGFADQAKAKAKDEFGKGLARLNMLFAASLKIQDYKACLAIQKEINLMMGFTNKSTLEHIGNVSTSGEVTQKLQVEFIPTKKKLATNESEIDLKRLSGKVLGEPEDAIIIEDENKPQSEEPAGTGLLSDIPSEQSVQGNDQLPGANDNTPGWDIFG